MKGAIFDMDGLLFDTERLYQKCWHQLAAERGFTLSDTFAAEICGKGELQAHAVLLRYFPGNDPAEVLSSCVALVMKLEETELSMKPGAKEILAAMKAQGFFLAVASSSHMEMIQRNLASAGILSYFDALVSGDTVKRGKPFPDIFLKAASRISLPPAECYVFEDSINGILAAHAAGCAPVMIPDLVQPNADVQGICSVFPDLLAARDALLR